MKEIRRSAAGPPKIEGRGPGAIHPYEALAAAWFLLYLTVPLRSGDDGWFYTVFHNYFSGELIPFLNYRYHTWSTRLILEALTLALLLCAACALLAGELRHKRAAWAVLGCGAGAVVLQFIVFQLSGGAE